MTKPTSQDGSLIERVSNLVRVGGANAGWSALCEEVCRELGRSFDERLLVDSVEAAIHCGRERDVVRLVSAASLPTGSDAVPAFIQTIDACRRGDEDEITKCMDRLRMGGAVSPAVGRILCGVLSEAGRVDDVCRLLRQVDLTSAGHGDVTKLRRYAATANSSVGTGALRVLLTGTVTMDTFAPSIEVGLAGHGLAAKVETSGFGMMHQDLRDAGGVAGSCDFVVLGYDVANLVPELVQPRRDVSNVERAIADGVGRLSDSVSAFRSRSSAGVVLHTICDDAFRFSGFSNRVVQHGSRRLAEMVNESIADICRSMDGVYLIDVASLADDMGRVRFRDARRRMFGRFPASSDGMAGWGLLAADCIAVAKRGPKKVVVCDLDDTLWGGIVGDVGPMGVQVGADHPGNAFLEFQRGLLDLVSQGMLIALCSKNDEATALRVFAEHPNMAMTLGDVAAHRISWNPKSQSIVELGQELNLGIDSFVFLDDSPQERAAVRLSLPEVLVPELPLDPVDRPGFLRSSRAVWPVRLTDSDRYRTEMYQGQKKRRALQATSADVDGFLRSLGQVMQVGLISDGQWSRVGQMHLRTNQFNMTTRRYDESVLRSKVAEGSRLFVGSLRDCFGDQGIVIAALVVEEGRCWRLDSFLMSCRVMGRHVERAFVNCILAVAKDRGIERLIGEFVPTERNGPAREVYRSLGFEKNDRAHESEGGTWWSLDVAGASLGEILVDVDKGDTVSIG
jgi:FkbH-like protein